MSFEQKLHHYQQRVNTLLDSKLAENEPLELHRAMRHASLNGGKRLRPVLAYATAETLGIAPEKVDAAACAVEIIHAYSLVHDDLPAMDDDDLRRGQPTTHIAFGEAQAILAGDALQARAFELLAEDYNNSDGAKLKMVSELARAAGAVGMCGGQALDLSFEHQRPDQTTLESMFRGKTGRMITAPVVMAAISAADGRAAAADIDTIDSLREFADCAGLAFQIHDDVLDIEAETDTLGKPQGSDAEQNKATWPALFGLQEAKNRSQQLYNQALAALEPFGQSADPLRWIAAYIIERDH